MAGWVFLLALASTLPALAQGAEPAGTLFELSSYASSAPGLEGAEGILLHSLDFEALARPSIRLPIPTATGGLAWLVADLLQREERGPGRISWQGRILGASGPSGWVSLTRIGGFLAGSVFTPRGAYEIRPVGGQHFLLAVPEPTGETCSAHAPPASSPSPAADPGRYRSWGEGLTQGGAGAPTIKILAVYAEEAWRLAGGRLALETRVQAAVDQANLVAQNSLVEAHFELVAVLEAVDKPTIATATGFLDTLAEDPVVELLRDEWSADLVAGIYDGLPSGVCGVGYVMSNPWPGFAPFGYSVTRVGCLERLTLTHEIGHNLGGEHNPENAGHSPELASYPWSYGHYVDGQFSTVMTNAFVCQQGCTRMPFFSNPEVVLNGAPAGIAEERDNHRTFNLTALLASNFRADAFTWGPETPTPGSEVTFSAHVGDPGWTWDFGDGAPVVEGRTVTHRYDAPGLYTVTLRVASGAPSETFFQRLVVGSPAPCSPAPDRLCLQEDRFEVTAIWTNSQGQTGPATAVPLTGDTGYFWFFQEANVEMVVKVLNGCSGPDPHFWVFAGGLTNVEVALHVRDAVTGATRSYLNALSTPFEPIQDTRAFPSCP